MRLRMMLLVLLAFVAAGAAALFVRQWAAAQRPAAASASAPAKAPEAAILVAARDLAAGHVLAADDLRWQRWPEDALAARYVKEGAARRADFAGAVVRRGLVEGEPVTPERVVSPGERGFLAAILAPGMRAVTVPVDATSGVAGLVFPGDRVDIILTHAFGPDQSGARRPRRASETVLRDVRVLAMDRRIDDAAEAPRQVKTATLEVTPKQAEKLSLVAALGRLSLSLRSVRDGSEKRLARPSYTLDSEVSAVLVPPPKSPSSVEVEIMRGAAADRVSFPRRGVGKAGAEGRS